MKWLAKTRFINVTVAVLAVLAWFAGTNHCALGLIKQPQTTGVPISHCPEHSQKSRRRRARYVWDVGLLSGTSEFEYRRLQGEDLL